MTTVTPGGRTSTDLATSLIKAYRKRDDRRALERLFEMNGGLLKSIVRRYRHSSRESYEDLLQVGHVGLMKAVQGYDVTSKAKFSSYAYSMIEGEIKHYLRDSSTMMRKPRWARSLYVKVSHATAKLMAELGRPPLAEEIAAEVNIAPEGIREVLKVYLETNVGPLDESRTAGTTSGADLSTIKSLHHETFSLPVEDRIWLEQAMNSLSEMQRKVLHHLYYEDLSQTETGERLGLSQRKVSRIAAASIKQMSGMSHA